MSIVWNTLSGAPEEREEDPLGCAALMGRNDVGESGEILGDSLEPEKTPGSCVGLISLHHPGPLFGAHCRRPAVGQKIDQNIFGANKEWVVARGTEDQVAFGERGEFNRLDRLDLKRLYDRLHRCK